MNSSHENDLNFDKQYKKKELMDYTFFLTGSQVERFQL
jgi:hypothetical protein